MRINRSIVSNQNESVPTTRTITINGTTYDLSANRTWTVSGDISGSGTANRLPKFTTSTAIGNSLVYDDGNYIGINASPTTTEILQVSGTMKVTSFTGIGTTADGSSMLLVKGDNDLGTEFAAVFQNDSGTNLVRFFNDGKVNFGALPTSSTGLSSGDVWNDSGTLKIV